MSFLVSLGLCIGVVYLKTTSKDNKRHEKGDGGGSG